MIYDGHVIFFMPITVKDIKIILESSDFRNELEELSSYAAKIKQERPIVILIAKHFWRQGHQVVLEKNKCDLVVGETKVEFKFHFDWDMGKLKKELDKFNGDVEALMGAVYKGEMHDKWTVSPAVYNDIVEKRPDIFVWIIHRRDLRKLSTDELSNVCMAPDQQRYNQKSPFDSNERETIEVAEGYLSKIQKIRCKATSISPI